MESPTTLSSLRKEITKSKRKTDRSSEKKRTITYNVHILCTTWLIKTADDEEVWNKDTTRSK